MSHLKLLKISFFLVLFCLLFTSCFKDVDFEQSQDIVLQPDIETGLLFYQLNENDFIDSGTNQFTPVIRDTVRLEFLDDDYVQDGLKYAEFRFRHENSFPNEIKSKIKFLGKSGRSQFSVNYDIPAGSETSFSVVDTIHVMQGNDVGKVKRSIQMVVELQMTGDGKNLKGGLDFSSSGLFKFEF